MRTKLLLTAAVLAAGVASSMAQSNVYSLNIVGYVNKTIPSGYSVLANPLSNGATNGANEVMTLIDGSQYLTWNGAGYNYVSYDLGFGGWIDSGFNPAQPPALPPGKAFFFFNPLGATTNTFVGNVIPAPGTTNTLNIVSGYNFIGSVLPASATDISAAPVSLPLIDGMQLLKWNGASFTYSSYDLGFGGWIDGGFNPISAPSYTVGDGFFLFNPVATQPWKQNLP